MIIFPAVDVYGPDAVKFSRKIGKPGVVYGAAAEVAERWITTGARWLHVVDLHGALGLEPNRTMNRVVDTVRIFGCSLQLGGGLRTDEAIEHYLGGPAPRVDRATVSTRAIRDPEWLGRMAATYPDKLVVALDAFGDRIAVDGWKTATDLTCGDVMARVKGLPLAGYMYTNLNVEGEGAGIDWNAIEAFAKRADRPVVYSGGVTTIDDVKRLKEYGAYGVILGTAIYSGTIDLAEALRL